MTLFTKLNIKYNSVLGNFSVFFDIDQSYEGTFILSYMLLNPKSLRLQKAIIRSSEITYNSF